MAQGFYELLGVEPDVGTVAVRDAYLRRLAELVRRLRSARRQGADVSILEAQERALREAMEVLSDPVRRRRYDAYRAATLTGLPDDAESLWESARGSLVDPVASLSLEVVRVLTELPVGEPLPVPPHAAGRRRVAAAAPIIPLPDPKPAAAPAVVAETDPGVGTDPGDLRAIDDDILVDGIIGITGGGDLDDWWAPTGRRSQPGAALSTDPGTDGFGTDPLAGEIGGDHLGAPLDDVDAFARDLGLDGAFLRAVREHRGMTLDDLARATRISTRYLQAIESNAFDSLPSATFVRGYLKQLATVLEVADRGVVDGFMDLYRERRGG